MTGRSGRPDDAAVDAVDAAYESVGKDLRRWVREQPFEDGVDWALVAARLEEAPQPPAEALARMFVGRWRAVVLPVLMVSPLLVAVVGAPVMAVAGTVWLSASGSQAWGGWLAPLRLLEYVATLVMAGVPAIIAVEQRRRGAVVLGLAGGSAAASIVNLVLISSTDPQAVSTLQWLALAGAVGGIASVVVMVAVCHPSVSPTPRELLRTASPEERWIRALRSVVLSSSGT